MVDASTFGAEFIVACTCLEAVEGLWFKLCMFSIPVEGPTDMMCDNNSVVNNLQCPESVLSKKHLSNCYHRAHEAPMRQWLVGLYEWERLNPPTTWQIFLQRLCQPQLNIPSRRYGGYDE